MKALTQTEQNLTRLAMLCRGEKDQFKACCQLARKLNLPSPKRQQKPQSAAAARLQNFIKGIDKNDLRSAIALHGPIRVHNFIATESIVATAAAKFAEMAAKREGK